MDTLLETVQNLLILLTIYGFFMLMLSVDSLYYHAAMYHASPQAVETFIKSLLFPLNAFFSYSTRSMYYHSTKYSPEQIAASSMSKRYLSSIFPILFMGATFIGLIWIVILGDPLPIDYPLGLPIMYLWFRAAWRFGGKLQQIEADVQSENSRDGTV